MSDIDKLTLSVKKWMLNQIRMKIIYHFMSEEILSFSKFTEIFDKIEKELNQEGEKK